MLWIHKTKSPINVQQTFRCYYVRNFPATKSVKRWHDRFKETGSVANLPRSTRTSIIEAVIERVRQSFPTQSTCETLPENKIFPAKAAECSVV